LAQQPISIGHSCVRYLVRRTIQQRSQNDAEEAMPSPRNKLAKILRWRFIQILTVRKQTERTVGRTLRQVTGLPWTKFLAAQLATSLFYERWFHAIL